MKDVRFYLEFPTRTAKRRSGKTNARHAGYYGMRADTLQMQLGTWLEPEEITYPSGAMIRRARAYNVETGRLLVVRCGIADTYFSIPVRGGGWLGLSDGQILCFHPPIRSEVQP